MAEVEFDAFVAARSRALLRTAFALTGDHHRAQDLLQTSLLKTYGRWSGLREPEAYVRQVMVRTYASWWHRRWRTETPTFPLPETVAVGPDAESGVHAAVIDALAELPPRQRAVLVLRYFDDCADSEIAALLDISPGTVKSQASRALAKLRESDRLAHSFVEDVR